MLPWPVVTITVTGSCSAWIFSISFMPPTLGIRRSVMTRLYGFCATGREAARPVLGRVHLQTEAHLEQFLQRVRVSSRSSTTSTRWTERQLARNGAKGSSLAMAADVPSDD